jgi:hypothetical protein
MIICSLGRGFAGVNEIEFNSARTILDFDAVFIDTAGLVEGNGKNPHAIQFRREEFSEFLALGRTIVVFTAPVRLEVFLPITAVGVKPISGNRVDFRGPDHLKVFWESVRGDTQFMAHFTSALGQDFLFVSATNKSVGTMVRQERGHILFLPWLKIHGHGPSYQEICSRFVTAFKKLNEHLSPKKHTVTFPAWSTHYGWEREHQLRTNLTSLQVQADDLSKKIIATTSDLEIEDKLKVLFTGKGEPLVETVISVLVELGAKAVPGEPGRDDIVVEFKGKHAVVEVKGKKSSAAESDAAQLEKWVAGFKEQNGTDPKGILLIDAYCETPLNERTEPAFPNQMLKYSTQREHCLATTTQLLGLLLEARAHPEKRVDLVNGLFSTIGVYQEFQDWRAFLIAPAPAPTKTS